MRLRIAVLVVIGAAALLICFRDRIQVARNFVQTRFGDRKTVTDRMQQYALPVAERLSPEFDLVGLTYPPKHISILAFKDSKVLELYAGQSAEDQKLVKRYPVLAASGVLGPKLREGDRQVPEGVYRVESLNPNSLYHLSIRLNYPNEFDRDRGAAEGRDQLGGDIMIHGSNMSIGCLAMGDEAAEELFMLVAYTGVKNVTVIISPTDFRSSTTSTELPDTPAWIAELYKTIREALEKYG